MHVNQKKPVFFFLIFFLSEDALKPFIKEQICNLRGS